MSDEFTIEDIFETPFGDITKEDTEKMDEALEKAGERKNSPPVCDCPFCLEEGREDGVIWEADNTFYCSNSTIRNDKVCNFILYKNNIERLIRREIRADEVKELCETGRFKAICTKIGGDKEYTGIFIPERRDRYVSLRLTFPEREKGGKEDGV